MQIATAIERSKYDFFRWRYALTIPQKLALALGMAAVIGLLAQVRLYTPWTPVPITGQTLAALLAGVVMGRNWGGISVAIYAILGIAGVPWFTPETGMAAFTASGIGHFVGPTGGYIVGMVLAALFLGYVTDKYVKSRGFMPMLGLMLFSSLVIIYMPGLIWLAVWLKVISGTPADLAAVLAMGALPFIAGDVIKSVLASVAARAITPRQDYSR